MVMIVVMVVAVVIVTLMIIPVLVVIRVLMFMIPAVCVVNLHMTYLALALLVPPMLVMVITVSGGVHVVIPAIRYEIDGPSTGVVFVAVSCPVPFVTRRHMQVQRWWWSDTRRYGHWYRDNRPWKNQLGRRNLSADIDLTIQARCVDIQRDTHIAREGQSRDGE
jgi:hypothetical protein